MPVLSSGIYWQPWDLKDDHLESCREKVWFAAKGQVRVYKTLPVLGPCSCLSQPLNTRRRCFSNQHPQVSNLGGCCVQCLGKTRHLLKKNLNKMEIEISACLKSAIFSVACFSLTNLDVKRIIHYEIFPASGGGGGGGDLQVRVCRHSLCTYLLKAGWQMESVFETCSFTYQQSTILEYLMFCRLHKRCSGNIWTGWELLFSYYFVLLLP